MRCNFILVALVLSFGVLKAQTYHFDNYSVKDGLSQSSIYAISQDDEGNIWIGNKSGISLFDGISFQNYATTEGIASNGARTVFKDSSGTIWFGHLGGGITKLSNGIFEVVSPEGFELNTDISGIAEDPEGRIWLSTNGNGVFRINNPNKDEKETYSISQFASKDGLSDRVFDLYRIGDQIFFVTDVGIKKQVEGKEEFESHNPENLSTFFQFTTIFQDSEGNIWYGTYNGGLYKQIKSSDEFKIYDIKQGLAFNWISCISEDSQGRMWVGTWGGGITLIDDDNLMIFNEQNGLPDLKIFDISVDREGNVLIGTNENGLFIFKGEHFVAYTVENGLSNDQVWAVLTDKFGKIWLGTSDGITIMEEKDGQTVYSYINQESNNFIDDDIRFLKEDKNGNIWVGTNRGGVIKVDPAQPFGPYEYPSRMNAAILYGLTTAMDIDNDNNLWVGTLQALLYYEIDNGTMSLLTKMHGLAGNEISEIYADSEGIIWVGSKGDGLTKIKDTSFTIFDLKGKITPNCIIEDNEKNIWIGTDGNGLFLSKDKKTITGKFSREDGILANLINLVEVDRDNNIWIGTNKGLNKFNRSTSQFFAYTEQDGFTGIETKSNASHLDEDGILYFGTVRGLIRYDASKDKSNHLLPLVRITSLKVNLDNRRIKEGEVYTYKEKSFYFDYKGIYLTNPVSVRYKYMLEGIDENWSAPTTLTFANYPALPHGKYVFKVMASNNSGRWTDEPVTYSFEIKPPFWKTWWFYIFCVIFVGSWIVYLVKKREENLLREKKLLEDKVEERTAEIQEKNKELASKNKDITDSIRYAERIQRAILPPDEMVKKLFPESFVFYRPKDIVSGDFYWVSSAEDNALFSAVDCTGHGVPGAFMSIVGHNLLDKIVKEEKIYEPALILDSLNNSVSETLRQRSEANEVKDGMDLGLVSINAKNKTAQYAGAHNPMYIFRKGELIETKADKFAIGSFIRGEKRKFTNHHYELEKGDVIYVFSDGFPDQFGGPLGKKYKYRPFKEFIQSICDKPMAEQRSMLNDEFINWLGNYEQIDDVIIIGVRIT